MRHFLVSGTLTAVLALSGSIALAEPPTDEQVRAVIDAFNERREQVFTGGSATREAVRELFADPLGDLDLAELTPGQIAMLDSVKMLNGIPGEPENPLREQAVQRLEPFAHRDDLQGAAAALLLLEMKGNRHPAPRPDEETMRQLLERALHHPRRDEAVRAYDIDLINKLAAVPPRKLLREQREAILGLQRLFEGAPSRRIALQGGEYFDLAGAVLDLQDPADAARHDVVRRTIIAYGQRALAEAGEEVPEVEKRFIASIVARLEGAAARGQLIGHPAPELTFLWSSDENITSLEDLKGNVVVLDFWATWCGPCIASIPNVRELQERYKDYPVKIIGVTSIQGSHIPKDGPPIPTEGEPEKEFELMRGYMKDRDITWTIAFSEQEVFNPDYGIRGIPHVVIIDAEGKVRHGGLHPGGPIGPKAQKIDALLKEAGLPAPPPVEEAEAKAGQ